MSDVANENIATKQWYNLSASDNWNTPIHPPNIINKDIQKMISQKFVLNQFKNFIDFPKFEFSDYDACYSYSPNKSSAQWGNSLDIPHANYLL